MKQIQQKIWMVFAFFSISFSIKAQDLIILTTGDEIQALVKEVAIDVIKYNRFDNPNGPLYSIEKNKVFMIKYQNGTKDVITQPGKPVEQPTPTTLPPIQKDTIIPKPKPKPVPAPPLLSYSMGSVRTVGNNMVVDKNKVLTYLGPYPEAITLYNQGRNWHIGATTMTWLEIGMLFLTGYTMNQTTDPLVKQAVQRRGLLYVGGMMVIGLTCNITGGSLKRKAIDVYNTETRKKYPDSY